MERPGWRTFRAAGIGFAIGLFALVMLDRELPQWLAETPPVAEEVLIEKGARRLSLLRDDRPYRRYRIALGAAPLGHKQQAGDGRTPEGVYAIAERQPRSYQYKALRLSYPNPDDAMNAEHRGQAPGSMVLIHGQPNGLGWLAGITQRFNWTNGSIALRNGAMEAVYRAVPDGTPVVIRP